MKKNCLALAALAWGTAASGQTQVAANLADLSLEQLSNIVVSTVSRREEPLAKAAASVYIITGDDIRRAGATSIPEALRLAPNLQVARSGASGYAITARGFNGTLANKLLVLVDGRTIYTPTFSGVFWDAQDVMMEDIDRIEVISGPGAPTWGANAVNGVINILTKSAADTQGTLLAAGGGTTESGFTARQGARTEHGAWRIYAKQLGRENMQSPAGTDLRDGSERWQTGFRSDSKLGANAYTIQGDLYYSEGAQLPQPQELRGANILARWSRDLGGGDGLSLQAYYDRTSRQDQVLDTYDLELSHKLAARDAHRFIWGFGMRSANDRIDNTAALAFFPADKVLNTWNVFVQDEIALTRELETTLGVRIDHNPYTGEEYLPSARLGWSAAPGHFLWTAWSRAVRTPSRFDRELFLPGSPPFLLAGGPSFESEVSNVYELGYRAQPAARLSWSATLFYHDLDKVRTISPGAGGATVTNNREGHTEGFETWATWRVRDSWRLQAGYTHLHTGLSVVPGTVDLQPLNSIGSDPKEWWSLRSSHDLGSALEVDLMVRHYGGIENRAVPGYTALDARLGWHAGRNLEVSLLLQNAADPGHIEWSPGAELERAVYLKATLRF